MGADFEAELASLEAACPGAKLLDIPGQRMIELPAVHLSSEGGWSPTNLRAILDCTQWPAQRPRLLVEATLTRHNAQPVNFNREVINGEAWFSYSFNAPYSVDYPALVPVVGGWLRRFDGRQD